MAGKTCNKNKKRLKTVESWNPRGQEKLVLTHTLMDEGEEPSLQLLSPGAHITMTARLPLVVASMRGLLKKECSR